MKYILLILSFVGVANVGLMAQTTTTIPAQNSSEIENRKVIDISISVFNNKLYVSRAPENSIVELRNMLGEKIFEARIANSDKEEFYLNQSLKKGFYIVKVGNFLQRFLIK